MNFLNKLFGDESTKAIKRAASIVSQINALEPEVGKLSDSDFPIETENLRQALQSGKTEDDILPRAFALVREAAKRTLGQRHYDVQLIGGIVLHRGEIAEMRTGEGKTLVATLAAYLNALSGKGVHIVTVNDYLARRDTQWMGQIYNFLGLSVGVINDQNRSYVYDKGHEEVDEERDEVGSFRVFYEFLRPASRQEAYGADITYGTNSQFGFDYLRDHTAKQKNRVVQREHHYVIVDEIDSILVDEARVPLILSAPAEDAGDLYTKMTQIANTLVEGDDYTVDEKLRAVQITNEGISKAEKFLNLENIYTQENIKLVHHLETAVRAKALFLKDRDYVVKNGQVIIVDPFTGRLQEGRRYSDGLHQALESKERVPIKQESRTIASITYQNYFRFYKKLSGMTGTAKTSEEEFFKVYGLSVVTIPTHRPIARIDHTDLIYQTEQGKFKAIAEKVRDINKKGQPVLIGTVSVEKNEMLSEYLRVEGIPHSILNAKKHEQEGEIIAQAGKKGAVTIATNMAGRGVDIKLGGNPTTKELEEEIKGFGGLFVLGTERHDARRIDDQLRGRSGRQGDPGETQFYVSLEDPLMRIFGGERIQGMIGALGLKDDEAIQNKFISNSLEKAQAKIEGFNFDARKSVLDFDNVLSHQRNTVYERRQKILFDKDDYLDEVYAQVLAAHEENREAIEKKKQEIGEELFNRILKEVSLSIIDMLWMEHLEVMDHTRRSVNLRAYGQKDPIVEYKKEGLRLFREMESTLFGRISHVLSTIDPKSVKEPEQKETQEVQEGKSETKIISPTKSTKGKVMVEKGGEKKAVKEKSLNDYLAAGWKKI